MSNTSVEIVLVLYGVLPEESKAFVSLLRHIGLLSVDYELIVYNNDTSVSVPDGDGYIAVNAEKNDMLARAYNFALRQAQAGGRQWLLLLDHDTETTAEYFEALKPRCSGGCAFAKIWQSDYLSRENKSRDMENDTCNGSRYVFQQYYGFQLIIVAKYRLRYVDWWFQRTLPVGYVRPLAISTNSQA